MHRLLLIASGLVLTASATAQTQSSTGNTATPAKHITRRTAAHHPPHIAKKPALIVRAPAASTPLATAAVAPAPVLRPAPFAQNPINQLRGNANVLLVFAPDARSTYLQRQLQLLDKHELTLTERDTVMVAEVARHDSDYVFPGENLSAGTPSDQLSARQKFGLPEDQFAIILLDKNGVERFRSRIPVTADVLASELDDDVPAEGNRAGR